jgi:PAS domain S-box-containing protein
MKFESTSNPILARNGHSSPSLLAPVNDWTAMGKSDHFVQFYEDDTFLVQSVAAFIGSGLRSGETAIVLATEAHRQALDERLRLDGIDPETTRCSGNFFSVDAAEMLAKFMVDGTPAPRLFKQAVGGLVARASQAGRPLRAFGEMVALLWQDKNPQAAIRLEELWNDLGKSHSFSLFCAYAMDGFCGEADGRSLAHICQAHSHVIPSESYSGAANSDDRLRAITLLQQKANSLEAEIAERKTIEQTLARRERELADFLENASEGIHQVAPDGKILWANKAELELLGYSAEEYIDRDIRMFHADPDVIADILNRLARGEKLYDFEACLRHKDGSLRHVSINSSGYWERAQFRYARCFTRDITDRKRAAEILEQAVAERTAQLRDTVAELEAFSYSISHDMRSPLRAMQGYAQAILQDYGNELAPAAVIWLQRIDRVASRLDLLVRDILAYSKLAKGQVELKPITLSAILEDLVQQHPELQAGAEHIVIEKPLHTVYGHEACLTQCLTNLIENALKFVPPGALPQVQIRSEALGDKVRVWVSDNGVGIAPEHHHRIFQIFGRVYPAKTYPGTGIGLAIVKKAAARMGGDAGFESEPGKGSRFWFTVPIATDA